MKIYDGLLVNKTNFSAVKKCFDIASGNKSGVVLFVCGESPCGKTKLLKTTAKKYEENFSEEAVVTTFKELVNDYIISLKNKQENFYEKYLKTHLVLIDDFHCAAGLVSTQESLAEIFKKLTENSVNIIIFSEYKTDSYEGLKSLYNEKSFSTVGIKKADYFLRKSFLKMISEKENIKMSKRVFRHIIFNKKLNISAIKGCVLKLKLMTDTNTLPLKDKMLIEKLREYEE
ncbi:MAG: hypothetical protein IJD88_05050 [Clostridia bacterium]|nr:hypothetical protein [Clostridia bacterium]